MANFKAAVHTNGKTEAFTKVNSTKASVRAKADGKVTMAMNFAANTQTISKTVGESSSGRMDRSTKANSKTT